MKKFLAKNSEEKSTISKNIRKIRTIKGISQTVFAEDFGLNRANISSYEEGRAEPKMDFVIQIAKKFGLDMEELYTKDLTVNDLTHFSPPQYKKKTIATPNEKRIKWVSKSASLDYASILNNGSNNLPDIEVPNIKDARAFEYFGDDIKAFSNGDVLYAKKIDNKNWSGIISGEACVVISSDRVYFKRLDVVKNKIALVSENSKYKSLNIAIDEIQEIWRVVGYLSFLIP
jgi:transcriptional regulator with XRE-family HTH domain